MKLIPLTDKIIVKKDAVENVSKGGIILTSSKQEQIYFGTVVAVGEGKTFDNGYLLKPVLKVGDRVCWSYLQGTLIELEDEQFYIIVESGILAKVENE